MKIQLKNFILHNFLSFENAEIDLQTPGYILVQGINNNPVDLAASNGSGKSALLEAVAWVLTGETIRGTKDVARIGSNSACYVQLSFDIDNNHYIIYRQSNPSKLYFKLNEKDISGKGVRDTTAIIHEYIPELSSQLIGSVIILGQGLPQRFTNNTPAGRKEILETLSNSDVMMCDLKERVTKRKKELDYEFRKAEDIILECNTSKSLWDKQLNSLYDELKRLPDFGNLNDMLYRVDIDLENNKATLSTKSAELDNIVGKINEQEKVKTEYLLNLNNAVDSTAKYFEEQILDTKSKLVEKEAVAKSLKTEILKIKNIKDICPTCGQKIPGVEKPSCEEQEKELAYISTQIQDLNNTIIVLKEDEGKAIVSVQSLHDGNIANCSNTIREYTLVKDELRTIVAELNQKIFELSQQKIKLENEIANYNSNKKRIEDKIVECKEELVKVEQEILYNNKKKDELELHITQINKINSVVTRDFRGYILSSIIEFISRKSKEYSKEVFETDKIEFRLDGNNISISYDGKEYENLSGGEKQKVDLIVQFAIRDMLCKYSNFSSNVLAVDELFDNLDSIGCEKVLNLISNKLNDVESIYIITHHSSIPIPFDHILTVTKNEEGISSVDVIQ